MPVAILDGTGTILAINEAWQREADEHRWQGQGVGMRYASCERYADPQQAGRLESALAAILVGDDERIELRPEGSSDGAGRRGMTTFLSRLEIDGRTFVVAAHADRAGGGQTAAAQRQPSAGEASLEQTAQRRKLESIGRLAGGVAHDFNNLLTAIISFSRFVYDDLAAGDPRREDLAEVLRAADSAARLTSQLLAFSRQRPVEPIVVELSAAVGNVDKLLRRTVGESVELVVLPAEEELKVLIDAGQLDQLIFNLVVNACDALTNGGSVTLSVGSEHVKQHGNLPAGEYAVLRVTDDGIGMSAETQANLFEPFFSTKTSERTGLGLATCYGIAAQAGGEIAVDSTPGLGTEMAVYLPRLMTPAGQRADTGTATLAVGTAATVLVVEDQPAILRMLSRSLERASISVLRARTAEEALAIARERDHQFDLLVADVVLPGLSGIELMNRLRTEKRDLKCLLISGYMEEEPDLAVREDAATSFLAKPFSAPRLLRQVGLLLSGERSPAPAPTRTEDPECNDC